MYLGRCHQCIINGKEEDTIFIYQKKSDRDRRSKFKIESIGNRKYTIKTDINTYLNRASGKSPGSDFPDILSAHHTIRKKYREFKIFNTSNPEAGYKIVNKSINTCKITVRYTDKNGNRRNKSSKELDGGGKSEVVVIPSSARNVEIEAKGLEVTRWSHLDTFTESSDNIGAKPFKEYTIEFYFQGFDLKVRKKISHLNRSYDTTSLYLLLVKGGYVLNV